MKKSLKYSSFFASVPLILVVAYSPVTEAADVACQQLLKRIEHLQIDSISYDHEINKTLSPEARRRFDTLGEKRDVPKGLHDEIRQAFNHYLIAECRSNPRQYTHSASNNAVVNTKAAVKDYLKHRS